MDINDWLPEFQISAEEDPQLLNYFLKTDFVDMILNSNKWLVVGRKGAGKSAIFEYFKKTDSKNIGYYHTIPVSLKDYPAQVHSLLRETFSTSYVYAKSWKYLLTIKILYKLIEIKLERNEALPSDLEQAYHNLKQIYGNINPSLGEIISARIALIDNIGIGNNIISFSSGNVQFDQIARSIDLLSKLRINIDKLVKYFEDIIKKHIGNEKILLVIDDLDQQWRDIKELHIYEEILVNLIGITKELNAFFRTFTGVIKNPTKIVIFLRADIFETLKIVDRSKIVENFIINLTWDQEKIQEMLSMRIINILPAQLQNDFKTKGVNILFESIKFGKYKSTIKYLLSRTFFRPRDILVFLNRIRNAHQTYKPKSEYFTKDDINSAELLYSKHIMSELIEEWEIRDRKMISYFTILKRIGYESFTRQEFIEKYLSIITKSTEYLAHQALEFLFNNNIVGYKNNDHVEFQYSHPLPITDDSGMYSVHLSLKKILKLKKKTNKRKQRPDKNKLSKL